MMNITKEMNLFLKVGQLHKFRVIPNLPKWYRAMEIVPPSMPQTRHINNQDVQGTQPFEKDLKDDLASHYQTQIQKLMESQPAEPSYTSKKWHSKLRPRTIVFPEDILRRRFYEQYPFELLNPQQLAESGPIEIDYSTPLSQREKVTGEDVIQHQLYLVSQGMTVDEAFEHVSREFVSIRLAQEETQRKARIEAVEAIKAKQPDDLSETEKAMADIEAMYPNNYALWRAEEEQLLKMRQDEISAP